ncbi:hypothetical protein AYI70_g5044 [Smittium culicis]|uniref:Uncharacterized protein n=1 Tax=Smittium culicis TaxID=133412 RepID=A0A1R1XW93_9FUNG|nr:hypothetical protein AYI70_g5044 [Smittium culicis]
MNEPKRVSSRKSGAKKGPQKFQNSFAFTHNKGSKTTKKILALPIEGLCTRCYDQIQWRKRYRKYKQLTVAATCVSCKKKNINKAYHVLCDACSAEKNVCAKCMESKEIVVEPVKMTEAQRMLEQKEIDLKLSTLRERERRSYLRKLERGDIEPKDILALETFSDFSDFSDSEPESD